MNKNAITALITDILFSSIYQLERDPMCHFMTWKQRRELYLYNFLWLYSILFHSRRFFFFSLQALLKSKSNSYLDYSIIGLCGRNRSRRRWSRRSARWRRKIDLILARSPEAPLVRRRSPRGRRTRWWTWGRWSTRPAAWWWSGVYRDSTAGVFESRNYRPTAPPAHT